MKFITNATLNRNRVLWYGRLGGVLNPPTNTCSLFWVVVLSAVALCALTAVGVMGMGSVCILIFTYLIPLWSPTPLSMALLIMGISLSLFKFVTCWVYPRITKMWAKPVPFTVPTVIHNVMVKYNHKHPDTITSIGDIIAFTVVCMWIVLIACWMVVSCGIIMIVDPILCLLGFDPLVAPWPVGVVIDITLAIVWICILYWVSLTTKLQSKLERFAKFCTNFDGGQFNDYTERK